MLLAENPITLISGAHGDVRLDPCIHKLALTAPPARVPHVFAYFSTVAAVVSTAVWYRSGLRFPPEAMCVSSAATPIRIYAYDAYFLQCALETKAPLLTLDGGMKRVAKLLDITVVEKA
jgi:hypothetical protein